MLFSPSLVAARTRHGPRHYARAALLILLAVLLLLVSACSKKEELPAGAASASASVKPPYQLSAQLPHAGSGDGSGKFASGEEVYQKVCHYCHDAGVGPVLKGRQLPPELIMALVRSGGRAMPAFRPSEIDDESLRAVGSYLQGSAAPATPAPSTPAPGTSAPATSAPAPGAGR